MAQVQQHLKLASLKWQKLLVSEKVSCPTLETHTECKQRLAEDEAKAVGNGKGDGVNWNLLNRNRQQHKQGYIFCHTRYTPRGSPRRRDVQGGVRPGNAPMCKAKGTTIQS